MHATLTLALASTAALGFRHGLDYDHIAAISDITCLQPETAKSMRLGVLYALGHAATIAVLGGTVIFGRWAIPVALGYWAERIIGATLIALAGYVLFSVFLWSHPHAPRSRIALLLSALVWLKWRAQHLFNANVGRPVPLQWSYSWRSVFLIGAAHGLGAETPTQLSLFLLAANLGGIGKGLLGLAMFIAGLLIMNALMTASATGLFIPGIHRPRLNRWISVVTAAYSFTVGLIFLCGASSSLPEIRGG